MSDGTETPAFDELRPRWIFISADGLKLKREHVQTGGLSSAALIRPPHVFSERVVSGEAAQCSTFSESAYLW